MKVRSKSATTVFKINAFEDYEKFFSVPGKPLEEKEFFDFWLSLTRDEQLHYVMVDLEIAE